MKKVLITGKDSYIGTSLEKWLLGADFSGMYKVATLDMRDNNWKEQNFSGYDAIVHVAGIAHRKETRENAPLYYQVNRDLAVAVAEKAKKDGVDQFVFLSSMSVYGMEEGVITRKTRPNPVTHYGRSKLQAERKLRAMKDENFKVAILRPPMVYGKGCKGNYPLLSKFAKKSPVFPDTDNVRSMIYIGNLCEFIREIIEGEKDGVYFPQNAEYVNISDMVKKIAEISGRRVRLVKGLTGMLKSLGGKRARKVLGTLIYDIEENRCSTIGFRESIVKTER